MTTRVVIAGVWFALASTTSLAQQPDSVELSTQAARWSAIAPPSLAISRLNQPQDSVRRRKAVAVSDWYSRRLTIHRYGSYTMLPLFVTQYILGNKLISEKDAQFAGTRTTPIDSRLRNTHRAVASAVGALFLVNTTTGVWNLIESRHNDDGRSRRTIHAFTMLAADAGFTYTGVLGARASGSGLSEARAHRNAALTSFGIATAGAAFMWFRRE